MQNLKKYYDMGIRLITLTWNYENCFGFPNSVDNFTMNRGLKKFGKEAIEYMNCLRMLIDVSHLSDGGFWDVMKLSSKPVFASHSNCRALCNHPRNLTDEMIQAIGDNGGVIGLNFAPFFLNENPKDDNGTIEIMERHLQHMIDVGGEDVVALGSDFDGISGNLEILSTDQIPFFLDRMESDGMSASIVEKIAYKNAYRVIKETIS
ncbi:MAG: membrane dipeptidase [Lachnospiraceae bacterium]|nr:membrane dipeptidase [Lachnospiraceae bacterium]